MKIDGVDIRNCRTSFLLKNYKMYLVMVPGYFLFSLFFAVAIVVPLVVETDSNMWPMVLVGLGGASIFAFIAISYLKKAKCIKKEIDSREVTEEERAIANNSFSNLIKITVGIIVAAFIIIVIVLGSSGDSSSSSGSTTCPNCGISYRSDHSAAEFIRDNGYCSTCRGR